MTTIRIVRAKEHKSSLREIKIEIDGIEISGVNNGEEKSFEVEPGPHKIQARLDKICTSNLMKVMLGENETIQLRLSH